MGQHAFQRLAIVNRGEAAMRCIRAVRELNWERSEQIRTIALFTEPDRHALFVRQADERYCLGPATGDEGPRGYLDYDALERALTHSSRRARMPRGWGGGLYPSIPRSRSCAIGSESSLPAPTRR
jgi:acetyl/propionyl-CoA carboxylase alpha subunit